MAEIKLTETHDWIRIKTPAGSFTTKRYGDSAGGLLATDSASFNNISNFIDAHVKAGGNRGEAMRELTKPEVLEKLWPGYATDMTAKFKAGDPVRFRDEKFRTKSAGGEVVRTKGKWIIYRETGTEKVIQVEAFVMELNN